METLHQKKLVGMHLRMSFAGNRTYELWHSFMPRRKEITNAVNADLISMQIYEDGLDPKNFKPDTSFEKWAAVEVTDHDVLPEGMASFTLPGGLYAVFLHHGTAETAAKTFAHIFGEWLTSSAYALDDRPHFEVLGEKYNRTSPDSEEEVWIPVRVK